MGSSAGPQMSLGSALRIGVCLYWRIALQSKCFIALVFKCRIKKVPALPPFGLLSSSVTAGVKWWPCDNRAGWQSVRRSVLNARSSMDPKQEKPKIVLSIFGYHNQRIVCLEPFIVGP